MKHLKFSFFLTVLLGMLSTQSFAQEHFYYYKGKKMALELNTDYLFLSAPQQNSIENARISTIIDSKSSTTSEKDNTNQTLLKPKNFQAKTPIRFWREVKLANSQSRAAYLSQIQTTRKSNPEVIVAPYFKTKNTDKIGLSNFFYVKLKDGADYNLLLDQIQKHDAELVGYNKFMPLWYTVSASPQSLNALQLANLFYETGLFAAAEPDLMVDRMLQDAQGTSGIELTPNDTHYGDQWGLNNTGQNGGTSGIDINAEAAWDITLGANTRVAVLDHGFENDHPDLVNNVVDAGYDTETGTSPTDIWGPHGTACAGIVAAEGNNSAGISGVAPEAGLISISNKLRVTTSAPQDLADGINWAWDDGEADVISNSWGHNDLTSSLIDDAIDAALTNGRSGLGTVVVFATGNSNNSIIFPASSNPDILAVGAMSPCGERKNPSSCDGEGWGWGSCYGSQLDIVAPGVLVPTTDRQGDVADPIHCFFGLGDYNPNPCTTNTYSNQDYYSKFNGTSSATPHVAGVAALVLSINPALTVQEVNDIIEQSAQKVRTDLYTYSTTSGRPNGTWNDETGYGLIDAEAAVILAQTTLSSACQFHYDFKYKGKQGNYYNLSLKVKDNGDYVAATSLGNIYLSVCSPYSTSGQSYPFTQTANNGVVHTMTITDQTYGCTETIYYKLENSQIVVQNNSPSPASRNEGCRTHECDLKFGNPSSKVYVYAYPHQGDLHKIRYRVTAPNQGLWQELSATTSHYSTIYNLLGCATYAVQVSENCGGNDWSPWSASKSFSTNWGCRTGGEQTSESTEFFKTGQTDALQVLEASVFPNPTNELLNVNFKQALGNDAMLYLYNMQGKLIHTQTINSAQNQVNMTDYAKGVYFLKVVDGESTYEEKVFKLD